MMRCLTRFRCLPFVGVALLAGCSWTGSLFQSDKVAYESAQQAPKPLEVPPDLSQLPRDDRFAVPGRPQSATASGQAQSQAGRPGAGAAPASAGVVPASVVAKIERQGNQRYLVVNLPPERVWPMLLEFWPTVGLQVEKSDPVAGTMETNWAETKSNVPQGAIRKALSSVLGSTYSSGEMDKYRARVERTPQDTSEIFIAHRGMQEVYTSSQQDQTRWTARPADPELEAAMLQKLLVKFDASAATPAVQTAGAPGTGAPPGAAAGAPRAAATTAAVTPQLARVVKGTDGRSERLEIDDNFERSWRRVGLALDRGAFTVEDRDRAKGTYFVRYLDPDYEAKVKSEQGFFTKIFGSDKPVPAPQYRVVVAGQSTTRTVVTVQSADGKPELSAAGDRILALLNDQLR